MRRSSQEGEIATCRRGDGGGRACQTSSRSKFGPESRRWYIVFGGWLRYVGMYRHVYVLYSSEYEPGHSLSV